MRALLAGVLRRGHPTATANPRKAVIRPVSCGYRAGGTDGAAWDGDTIRGGGFDDGFVDLNAAPHFSSCTDDVVANGTANVLIDLADLTFIDSTGVAALVDIHQQLVASRRRLRVVTSVSSQRASLT